MDTSLADELMNDLESDSGGEWGSQGEGQGEGQGQDQAQDQGTGEELGSEAQQLRPVSGPTDPDGPAANLGVSSSAPLLSLTRLTHPGALDATLARIAHFRLHPDTDLANDSEEYSLIVEANNLAVEIENEMQVVHKFIRDRYLPRFPELDTLVTDPAVFARVVRVLGNGADLVGRLKDATREPDTPPPPSTSSLRSEAETSEASLRSLLPPGTRMAVEVTAATTRGTPLSPTAWEEVLDACRAADALSAARDEILAYVESRISLLAPNVAAIVGSSTATKLLGAAGGLAALARLPSSSVYLLGAVRRAPTGFSAVHGADARHTGFIFGSPVVASARPEDRIKAQRKTGAKVALAARIDAQRGSPDGAYGAELAEQLAREFERLARPPPKKSVKALPVPQEGRKSRRGGKRARKAKEAYGMTQLRQMQNRLKFGEAETEAAAYDETRGLGMIGAAGGHVRAATAESRSKAKLSKASKGRLASVKTTQAASSGLATSLAFTPFQGIELVDPSKARAEGRGAGEGEGSGAWFKDDGMFSVVRR